MWTLISATPSPYSRKVRIALAEKNLPFTLQTEVPWDSTTQTPQYNPLEKLPVLILDDGATAVYESHYIMEWLEAKYPAPSLMPEGLEERLYAKKVEVVADGICDALVLAFFERMREEGMRSQPWMDRCVGLEPRWRGDWRLTTFSGRCAKRRVGCRRSPRSWIKPAAASF